MNAVLPAVKPPSVCRRLIIVSLVFLGGCEGVGPVQNNGAKAPEIKGEDVYGKTVTLSQFHGKVVLIDFWATWCKPCVAAIPHERDLHRQFDGRAFAIPG